MIEFSPTPYDGSSKPFTIGLKPLDLDDWLEIDHTYDFQMREKRRLYEAHSDLVFVAEENTAAAQREVLDLVRAHVVARFPDRFGQGSDGISIDDHPAEAIHPDEPLRSASLLIQEDLILMRRDETGWRLVAGSLCFPSAWTLREKFGLPLHEIHQPVPDFGAGTRNNDLINRMFDKLHQPVQRFNWSLQSHNGLYNPFSHSQRLERAEERQPRFPGDVRDSAFIRVERQTLRKLPISGDILFTIRIYLDPLRVIEKHPDRKALAGTLAEQLEGLNSSQLDYKGFAADRDRLVKALREIAAQAREAAAF